MRPPGWWPGSHRPWHFTCAATILADVAGRERRRQDFRDGTVLTHVRLVIRPADELTSPALILVRSSRDVHGPGSHGPIRLSVRQAQDGTAPAGMPECREVSSVVAASLSGDCLMPETRISACWCCSRLLPGCSRSSPDPFRACIPATAVLPGARPAVPCAVPVARIPGRAVGLVPRRQGRHRGARRRPGRQARHFGRTPHVPKLAESFRVPGPARVKVGFLADL